MPTNPIEYILPGILAAQAIHVATKLRIPDLLASGPKNIAELASSCGAHPSTLERLLRALVTLEMFALTPDGRFRNTPLTEVLRTDYPQSSHDGALFLPAPFFGVRSESFTNRFVPAIPPSRQSSVSASSTTSPTIPPMLQSSIPS